jgi:protein involved in temperature-dependent protein secretion
MPTAKELLDRSELDAAIAAQTQEVKANPGDPARRTFLFELLCFTGDWDRAEKQVDVLASANVQSAWRSRSTRRISPRSDSAIVSSEKASPLTS